MLEELRSTKARLLTADREGGFSPSASVQLAIVLESIGKTIEFYRDAKTPEDINVACNRAFEIVGKLRNLADDRGVIASRAKTVREISDTLYRAIALAVDAEELVGDDWLDPDPDNASEPKPEFVDSTSDARTVNNSATRRQYRVLNDDEKAQMDAIKDAGDELVAMIVALDGRVIADPTKPLQSRDLEQARTHIEDGVMRAVRHITA